MIWRVEKNGHTAYLVGTAHFFPYSFARSLAKLFRTVETVLFEGPLDQASLQRIAEHGRQGQAAPSLAEALAPESICEIDRQLSRRLRFQNGEEHYLLWPSPSPNYFELYTRGLRPWLAFFSIWSTCLDWPYSVDMEGFRLAQRLGKRVHFLETLEEQLAVLDGIPFERIVRQLNEVSHWPQYSERYVAFFLAGNLTGLMALTDNFVSRGRPVISERDAILQQRMKPIFDRQTAAAFVGFPHIPGICRLFLDQGYNVIQEIE